MSLLKSIICVAFILVITGCDRQVDVIINAPAGTIRGVESGDVQRFLGIPYAESTAGDNRWRPPVALQPWDGIFDAESFGKWCPQFDFERRDEGAVHSGEGWTIFHNVPSNNDSGEDCLTVNVFAPIPDNQLKPVVVFLHGNALGSSFPMYDGSNMARAGIVYVSINYRLHSLGIFAHPALTAQADVGEPLGRYSELDRLAALRWVQRNVEAFGGDPDQVTLAGNSEGGAAILQLLANPQAEGLFDRAIVQSGNGWWQPLSHSQHEELGCRLATMSGLDGCNASSEELRSLPWHVIPATGPYTIDRNKTLIGATEAIQSGKVIDVPLLIGWNDFDGSSLRYSPNEVVDHTHPDVLSQYDQARPLEDLAYDIYTDLHSGAPARWVASQMEDGAPVYLYLFSYVVSWDKDSVRGAEHGYELPHALNSWDKQLDSIFPFLSNFLLSDDDRRMTELTHQCWISFIKTGKPSCPNAPDWPIYQRETDLLMELNLEPKVISGYRANQLNAQELNRSSYFLQIEKSIQRLLADGV